MFFLGGNVEFLALYWPYRDIRRHLLLLPFLDLHMGREGGRQMEQGSQSLPPRKRERGRAIVVMDMDGQSK